MIATDLEEFIEQKIASGIYRSRDELVAAAVAALRDDDEFQSKLEQRIAESDRGLSTPLDIEAIKQRFAASIQQDESPLSHDPRVLKTPSAERDLLEVADFIYRKRTEMNTDTEEFIPFWSPAAAPASGAAPRMNSFRSGRASRWPGASAKSSKQCSAKSPRREATPPSTPAISARRMSLKRRWPRCWLRTAVSMAW